jgi:hypothetical protein
VRASIGIRLSPMMIHDESFKTPVPANGTDPYTGCEARNLLSVPERAADDRPRGTSPDEASCQRPSVAHVDLALTRDSTA